MLSDVRETFRTVNIFVNKEKCSFLYLWTCGYLSYTVGIKGGGGRRGGGGAFPVKVSPCSSDIPAQVSDASYEAANNNLNSLPIS